MLVLGAVKVLPEFLSVYNLNQRNYNMKTRKSALVFYLLFASFFCATAQTRIVKDSLLFSLSRTQLDSFYNKNGIPPFLLGLDYGVKAYKVIYRTLNYDSTPTIASGLIMIPESPEYCKLPISSYQHGTSVRKKDVPSRLSGNEKLITMAMASAGMVSCMPDYLGMGDGPGYHPYQNARTEAFSVIDIIRAAKEFCDTMKLGYSDQLFLVGYSQGGHATMAAHKMIQEQLSSEMKVTASAPMSGAYDMSGVQTVQLLKDTPYASPYYLPYLIFGNNPIYHFFTNANEILRSPYDVNLPPLMNGIANSNAINAKMNDTVKLIFRQEMLDSFHANPNHFFKVFLRDNDVYQWVPQSPMRMYYCTLDENVPYENTVVAYNYFKANGATQVDTVNSGALYHTPCAEPSLIRAKTWFDEKKDRKMEIAETHQNASAANSADGTLHLDIAGGRKPFTVSWDNNMTGTDLMGLAPGTYTYNIVDSNLCSKTGTVTISFTNAIAQLTKEQVSVYPNPTTNTITIFIGQNFEEGKSITVINTLGEEVKRWTTKNKVQTETVSDLAAGVYTLKIDKVFTQQFIKQ